ncbi:MAG: formate/nitrite transporter family protein [Kiritimatiellia bacterium]|nr:formate/nitrite transporter family protein [Lentisphaerota bacterium]
MSKHNESIRAVDAALRGDYDPALTTREFSKKISALGIKKANTRSWQLLLLGLLAGLYIAFGSHVSLVALEQGMSRIAAGAVFGVGLVLVVIAGAELFTGNIIMLVGAVSLQFSLRKLLRSWVVVYAGNFLGALLLAWGVWQAGLLGGVGALNPLGELAAVTAEAKIGLDFWPAFWRGFFCNMLVILAIIMATMSKDIISKVICCILPVMIFVASGFEHCVANMYFLPLGLMAQGAAPAGYLTMCSNLIPVTLGNIAGGTLILFIHPNRIRQLTHLLNSRK